MPFSEKGEHATEDAPHQGGWEVVEGKTADHEVVRAFERGLLDRMGMHPDRRLGQLGPPRFGESFEGLAEHRIDLDDVENVLRAHRRENDASDGPGSCADLEDSSGLGRGPKRADEGLGKPGRRGPHRTDVVEVAHGLSEKRQHGGSAVTPVTAGRLQRESVEDNTPHGGVERAEF